MAVEDTGTEGAPQLSEETQRLAEIGRTGTVPQSGDPLYPAKPGDDTKARPDYIPEKFWDAEKGEVRLEAMAKSYGELEKSFTKKPEPKDGADPKEEVAPADDTQADDGNQEAPDGANDPATDPDDTSNEEPSDDQEQQPANPELSSAIDAARTLYAETGALTDESFEALAKAGIPRELVERYLDGVKASEAAVAAAIYQMAGGEETYAGAVEWARDAWDDKRIAAFDKAIEDPALRETAVKGLVAAYREAVPAAETGEGQLTLPGGAGDPGDVYRDREEFLKDLDAATKSGSQLERNKAIAKLNRSKKAGTLKDVTPRAGMSSLLARA